MPTGGSRKTTCGSCERCASARASSSGSTPGRWRRRRRTCKAWHSSRPSGSLNALDKLPRDPVLITAVLASDPASLLTRLKSSNRDIERGRAIGQWRDKYPDAKHVPEVRRWLSQVGEHADDLLVLLAAGTAPRSPLPKVVESIRAAKDPLAVKDLALKGDDLLAAGVRSGPEVGETLERLLAEVLEDPTRNTRDYLLSRV